MSRRAEVLACNDDGDDVMLLAAKRGQIELFKHFSRKGLSAQILNLKNDSNSLHQASGAGHLEMVQLLIYVGEDLMCPNMNGETPLHLASKNGKLEIVQELLLHGAPINYKNNVGETALDLASIENHLKIVECLIGSGADIEDLVHVAARINNVVICQFIMSKIVNRYPDFR